MTAGSSQATSGTHCWGQIFTIDNVGNLTNMALSKCSGTSLSASANGNNQFIGYSYDAAGNLTNDGLYSYTYNAESEITTANGVTYTYDGNRMRVAKSSAPLYWRDINANTIAQTALNGTNQAEFVFFGGRRVARVNANGLVYYYQADQIGSTRAMTNSSGVRCYDADFPPYGTENSYTGTCSPTYKFAGYERDTETGLDYAMNRYYNSRIGRFMTPDPAGLGSASLSSPQSLNRYAFVLNNPLIGIDPLGLACVFISDDNSSIQEVDPTSKDYDSAGCAGDGGYYVEGDLSEGFVDPDSGDIFLVGTDASDALTFSYNGDPNAQNPLMNVARAFGSALGEMNSEGLRRAGIGELNGLLNNIEYSLFDAKYEGCTGQSQVAAAKMEAQFLANSGWKFRQKTVDLGFHTLVEGVSKNLTIDMDPLYGDVAPTSWLKLVNADLNIDYHPELK